MGLFGELRFLGRTLQFAQPLARIVKLLLLGEVGGLSFLMGFLEFREFDVKLFELGFRFGLRLLLFGLLGSDLREVGLDPDKLREAGAVR